MTDGHIFLSYRSIEADFALKLAADLKNAGVNLWMDRLDGIGVGMDWRDVIQQAINSCAAMIAIISPDYAASDYCKREIARADTLKRPIFPILLRSVDDEDWPLVIQRVQFEDFTDWMDENVYRERFDRLIRRLKSEMSDQLGREPDAETRYLISLIAELESRRGVLEYVEITAQADILDVRPKPYIADEWGFAELTGDTADDVGGSSSEEYAYPQNSLRNIGEAVEKHPRFVLVGEPGAGKTTTLRRLVLDAARHRLDNPRVEPLPLLLYLPQWGDENSPVDFVRAKWPLPNDPLPLLRTGEIILYLDGLNEMGANGAEKAKHLGQWLESPDAPKRVILTCRFEDYAGDLKLGNMPVVLARELDKEQIRRFAENYLKDRAAFFLEKILVESTIQKDDDRALLRLARNPYMLTALVIIFEGNHDLPNNTGALFRGLARALWRREEQRGTSGWIPYDQAEESFARLAFAIVDKNKPIDVPYTWALDQISAKRWWQIPDKKFSALLRVGQNASFIELQNNQVRFYHQLMQEYFAAVQIQRSGLEAKMIQPINRTTAKAIKKWDQVIVALCGISQDADEIVQKITSTNPYLAAKCAASGIMISEDTRQMIITQLLERMPDRTVRGGVVRALAYLGQAALPNLLTALHNPNLHVRRAAIAVLETIDDPAALAGLLSALHDTEVRVREAAVRVFERTRNPAAVPGLIELLSDATEPRLSGERICDTTADVLERIGTPEALAAVEQWRAEQWGKGQ